MQLEAMGAAAGFVFRQFAEAQAQRHERDLALITQRRADAMAADDSADRAARRSGGTWVRRFLVVAITAALIFALWWAAGSDVPIVIEEVRQKRGWLGLGPVREVIRYVEITGLPVLVEYRDTFRVLIGFYFGQGIKGR